MTSADETAGLEAYLAAAPSPYHAVAETASRLSTAGWVELETDDRWDDLPERCLVRRGGALVAWTAAPSVPAAAPFVAVGAHTDSPNLRVTARPDVGVAGWKQVAVEVYGGALINSWLDRDLGMSGRVAVDTGDGTEMRLLLVDRPLLRVPQLAIHLDRGVNDGLTLDKQQHLTPVWGLGDPRTGELTEFVAHELGVEPDDVQAWDLMLHDLTPPARLGRHEELLASARLDNLCSSWCATEALAATPPPEDHRALIVLFDHEEIGSSSTTGADGPWLRQIVERIVLAAGGDREDLLRALDSSYVVSADMAHATHPNYPERHRPEHPIEVNAGPVVKLNANQRYASDAASTARFVTACDRAGVPVQRYVHRNDLPCGSTIGPLTAANLGSTVVDVGLAQLSMHSARELCGAHDPALMVRALTEVLVG